jgi:hypothetical protein
MKGMSYTNLTLYRKFYLMYPQIEAAVRRFTPLKPNLQPLAEDFKSLHICGNHASPIFAANGNQ